MRAFRRTYTFCPGSEQVVRENTVKFNCAAQSSRLLRRIFKGRADIVHADRRAPEPGRVQRRAGSPDHGAADDRYPSRVIARPKRVFKLTSKLRVFLHFNVLHKRLSIVLSRANRS